MTLTHFIKSNTMKKYKITINWFDGTIGIEEVFGIRVARRVLNFCKKSQPGTTGEIRDETGELMTETKPH